VSTVIAEPSWNQFAKLLHGDLTPLNNLLQQSEFGYHLPVSLNIVKSLPDFGLTVRIDLAQRGSQNSSSTI
jgi:hypothetical protein